MKNRDTKKTTMTRVSEKNLMAYYPLKTKNIYICIIIIIIHITMQFNLTEQVVKWQTRCTNITSKAFII